jgi:hypothetical protein
MMRLPRPIGCTFLALKGETEELYKKLSRSFLQGTFPYQMMNLSMERFSLFFRVPLRAVHVCLKEGMQEETLLGGGDLRQALQDIRIRMLDSSLFQYGDSTAKLSRLVRYLEDRVYRSRTTDPELIRELNVALSSSFKGIESSSKVLKLLNDALAIVPEEVQDQNDTLNRVQILEILNGIPNNQLPASTTASTEESASSGTPRKKAKSPLPPLNLAELSKHIEGTPNLEPIKEDSSVSLVKLQPTQGSYIKNPEVKPSTIPEKLISLPQ